MTELGTGGVGAEEFDIGALRVGVTPEWVETGANALSPGFLL